LNRLGDRTVYLLIRKHEDHRFKFPESHVLKTELLHEVSEW
jgi:hypothetical protein